MDMALFSASLDAMRLPLHYYVTEDRNHVLLDHFVLDANPLDASNEVAAVQQVHGKEKSPYEIVREVIPGA